jgi:hypothetical protein
LERTFAPSRTSTDDAGTYCPELAVATTLSNKSQQKVAEPSKFILAPCIFEMLSFRLASSSKTVSCMPILFVMKLSTYGRTWVRGIDIWAGISNQPEFHRNNILKFGKDLGCFDVERRQGSNGVKQYFFRISDAIDLVDSERINGKLMVWMLQSLRKILLARPKQTPRIGLLLYAIFARKLVNRIEIEEYLDNRCANAAHIVRQINVLLELGFIAEMKVNRSKNSTHFLFPISE